MTANIYTIPTWNDDLCTSVVRFKSFFKLMDVVLYQWNHPFKKTDLIDYAITVLKSVYHTNIQRTKGDTLDS